MRFSITSLENQLEKHGFRRMGKGEIPEEAITSAYGQMTYGERDNVNGMEFYVASGAMLGGEASKSEEDARSYWCYIRGIKRYY